MSIRSWIRGLTSASQRDSSMPRANRKQPGRRLLLERLEDRCVPNAASTLDQSFGVGGKIITDFKQASPSYDGALAWAVALQSDGKIVVAGVANRNSELGAGADFAVVRYNANGSVDSIFGNEGRTIIDFGSLEERATSVAVQADGKIVVAGIS